MQGIAYVTPYVTTLEPNVGDYLLSSMERNTQG